MSQLPFRPEDLDHPALAGSAFLELLDDDYQRRNAEVQPFFAKLFAGELTTDQLKIWAKDLYLYWDSLYFSTGGIFIKTNETTVRAGLLRKLVEVEGRVIANDVVPDWTNPAYEELWIRFGESLGLAREEITSWQTFTRSFFAISTLCMYSRGWEWSWLDGLANLYGADKFYLDYLERARIVLVERYDIAAEALRFFDAVVGDARENVAFEADGLAYWACTTERQLTAARAFRERIDIERQVIFSLDEVVTSGELPFQIPAGATIPALLERH